MVGRNQQRNLLDPSIEDEDVTLLVGKVRALAIKMTDGRLQEHGLDLKHYAILSALDSSHAPSRRELADYLNVVPRRIVPQLKSLEKQQFIVRSQGADRRSHTIEITEIGREKLTLCRQVVVEAEDEYLRPLTQEQRDSLRDALLGIARSRVLDHNLIG